MNQKNLFVDTEVSIDIEPLISALLKDRAVIFVGAGASIPVGLPSWTEFLLYCIEKAYARDPNNRSRWMYAEKLVLSGEFLIAAEILENGLGTHLHEYVREKFGAANDPSQIHRAVARLPFSLALTTNYDRLLENALKSRHSLGACTWKDSSAIFRAIKDNQKLLIKLHGTVDDPDSIVLTKSHYRRLMYGNSPLNSSLSMLLALRTFLFVGTSLRDHDVLGLLDQVKSMYGSGFGPHFAILCEDETNKEFEDFLKSVYSISVIVARASRAFTLNMHPTVSSEKEAAVASVLKEISGRVAIREINRQIIPNPSDPLFNQVDACRTLLENAIDVSDSFRGEICLTTSPVFQSVHRVAVFPTDIESDENTAKPHLIPNNSVIGRLFLKKKLSDDFIYIPDVRHSKAYLNVQDFCDAEYLSCHSEVRSELAVPIYSDGVRVGVLNIESRDIDAYTRDHVTAMNSIAARVGSVYQQAKLRGDATAVVDHYLNSDSGITRFCNTMNKSRFLSELRFNYAIWKVDYRRGTMSVHSNIQPQGGGSIDFYRLQDRALVTYILRTGVPVVRLSADEELQKGDDCIFSPRGCAQFDVRGPTVGIPVYVKGHTSAVLVAWSNNVPKKYLRFRRKLATFMEEASVRLLRMANLMFTGSNVVEGTAHTAAEKFIDDLDAELTPIDEGKLWTSAMLRDDSFRTSIMRGLLQCVTKSPYGLGRARLWLKSGTSFRIISSFTAPASTVHEKSSLNEYVGISTDASDIFVQYTMMRFRNDPYARYQHKSMFNSIDPNCSALDKDPDGGWIVAPIISHDNSELLGFISADCHKVVGGRIADCEDYATSHPEFHRYMLDIVSNILSKVLAHEG